MAKEKEVLLLNIRKDENSASRTFGMYFSEVEYKGLLSTRALSDNAQRSSIFSVAGMNPA